MGPKTTRNKLCIALDVEDLKKARKLVSILKDRVGWFKVGQALFVQEGPAAIRMVKASGARVFLDLKFHDIPNTVEGAARAAARMGVDLFTVHASGGKAMMAAAIKGAQKEARLFGNKAPRVIAVTILTSLDQDSLKEQLGIKRPLSYQVLFLARQAKEAGLHGVVCSGRELPLLRGEFPKGFFLVTPGIQFNIAPKAADQKRTVTPAKAIQSGSDLLVIGRAVIEAEDPLKMIGLITAHILKS